MIVCTHTSIRTHTAAAIIISTHTSARTPGIIIFAHTSERTDTRAQCCNYYIHAHVRSRSSASYARSQTTAPDTRALAIIIFTDTSARSPATLLIGICIILTRTCDSCVPTRSECAATLVRGRCPECRTGSKYIRAILHTHSTFGYTEHARASPYNLSQQSTALTHRLS